jgi:hypothetical protein
MLFLLPFLVHHAVMEKKMLKAQQEMAATQEAQYQLLLAEHNAHYGSKAPIKVDHNRKSN